MSYSDSVEFLKYNVNWTLSMGSKRAFLETIKKVEKRVTEGSGLIKILFLRYTIMLFKTI